MSYPIERVNKAYLKAVTDTYIDFYKRNPSGTRFYFACIDPTDFKDKDENLINYESLMKKLRKAIKENTPVNLILERRDGKPDKKQKMDYLILAEFC